MPLITHFISAGETTRDGRRGGLSSPTTSLLTMRQINTYVYSFFALNQGKQ